MTTPEIAPAKARSAPEGMFEDEEFFLSFANMTATVDQRDLEAKALEVVTWPVVVAARANALHRFKIMGGADIPAEALEGIEAKMDEWTFHYVINALNSDPNYPKVLGHGYGPPHNWLGMEVPGCRGLGTGENVDNHYSFIPLDGHSRFEVYGKLQDPPTGDCPLFLTANLSQSLNVNNLDWRDVQIAEDGTFVITVDPEPANGRPNHLQTTIDVKYLFVRDGRRRWEQRPSAFRVRRLDPPTAPPRTDQELAELGARFIIDDVPQNFWFKQMVGFLESNTITDPDVSSAVGGMQTQKLLRGRVDIGDDEAFVLDLGGGESEYWVLISYDWWLMSGNFWSRQSSLNDTQSVANPDGSYTFVFSITDPGVHNWIDTLGLHHTLFMHRWQLLPKTEDGPGGDPWAKARVVKLADLEQELPAGTTWVSPEERERILAERLATFNERHEL